MEIPPKFQNLFNELAQAIQSEPLKLDENGHLKLIVDELNEIFLIPDKKDQLTVMLGVMPLPTNLDYGCYLWLLRKNFHDSSLAPLCVSCDLNGSIVIWGKIPISELTGHSLAGILSLLAEEANVMREELQLE